MINPGCWGRASTSRAAAKIRRVFEPCRVPCDVTGVSPPLRLSQRPHESEPSVSVGQGAAVLGEPATSATSRSWVLVLLPAHNEAATIELVLQGLRRAAPYFDRLVIDDASTDATSTIVEALGERLLRLPCQLGYGGALQTGIRHAVDAGYDIVVFLDADGQHDPKDVPRLVSRIEDGGADVVIGSRYVDRQLYEGPFGRRMGQRILSHISRLMTGRRIYDTTSGLKAIRADALHLLTAGPFQDFHIEALVKWSLLGFRIEEVPISAAEREHGESMHSWRSAIIYPLKTLLLTLVAATDAWIERSRT
jgi:glycosyltransferase involved in cell wall biosynthesis